jgi:hypothetical protein
MEDIDVYQEQVYWNIVKMKINFLFRLVVHVKQANLDHHSGSQFYLE